MDQNSIPLSSSLMGQLVLEREFIRLLNDEAGSHSIYNLYGLSVTNFILRSLAVVLQVSNSVLCLTASIKARKKRSEVNGH